MRLLLSVEMFNVKHMVLSGDLNDCNVASLTQSIKETRFKGG